MPGHLLRDLQQFLKRPNELPPRTATTGTKLKELGLMLLIYFVAMLVVSIPIMVIESQGWLNFDDHAVQQLLGQMPVVLVLVLAVVVVPFLEELVFRLPLRFRRNIFLRTWVSIASGFGKKEEDQATVSAKKWWNRSYWWIFYLTAFIFALVHITNFNREDSNFWMFVPFLIMPQFVGGLLIGYLRLRNGFYWGFFLHAANNFIFLGATLLFASHDVLLHENNDRYELKIEEVSPLLPARFSYTSSHNGMKAEAYRFDLAMAHALNEPSFRISVPEQLSPSKKLNIHLECHNPELNCRSILLGALQQTFNFRVDSILKRVPVYELHIEEPDLLASHRHTDPNYLGNAVTEQGSRVSLENFSVKACSALLSGKYKIPFLCHGSDTSRYDFSLPLDDIESLRETLQTKYGIELKVTESQLMYYQVVPNESGG